MKCLIAEDNRQNRKLLKEMLQPYGECQLASNGTEAMQAFVNAHEQGCPFDVVFLDIIMPELDGHTVLNHMRDWEKSHAKTKVPIVMATGKSDTDTIISSYDKGSQHFFMKPYDRNELQELMIQMGFSAPSKSAASEKKIF